MSETTEIPVNTDLGDPEYIRPTPGSLRLIPGVQVVGRFARLERAPFDPMGNDNPPWIAVFTDCTGLINDRDGDATSLDPTNEYGLWLIHTMAREGLKTLRPEVTERVAMLYEGTKESRRRTDSFGNPQKYHAYRFACPDRPAAAAVDVSWDTVDSDDVAPY